MAEFSIQLLHSVSKFVWNHIVFNAPLAELVDAPDLGSGIERCESSSLLGGTNWMFSTAVVRHLDTVKVSGSIPLTSTTPAPMDKLVKSSLSKGEVLSVRIRVGVPFLMPWWRNW